MCSVAPMLVSYLANSDEDLVRLSLDAIAVWSKCGMFVFGKCEYVMLVTEVGGLALLEYKVLATCMRLLNTTRNDYLRAAALGAIATLTPVAKCMVL